MPRNFELYPGMNVPIIELRHGHNGDYVDPDQVPGLIVARLGEIAPEQDPRRTLVVPKYRGLGRSATRFTGFTLEDIACGVDATRVWYDLAFTDKGRTHYTDELDTELFEEQICEREGEEIEERELVLPHRGIGTLDLLDMSGLQETVQGNEIYEFTEGTTLRAIMLARVKLHHKGNK